MFSAWTMAAVLTIASGLAPAGLRQSAVPHGTTPDLRCFWPHNPPSNASCGCELKVTTLSCDVSDPNDGRVHFFSELNDGAPLWINLGGRQVRVPSVRTPTDSFLHRGGDRWRETYRDDKLTVQIDYGPGKSTCPKEGDPDGCEYFDVSANVTLTLAGQRPRRYAAVGACGC
jgi:hypothetical protein